MSTKTTRSSKPKETEDTENNFKKAPAIFKIFYISETLLNDSTNELHLQRFFHPGRGAQAWFITNGDKDIMEVLEFAEQRRSWLINTNVCSNGRIYMTTPIDVLFLALHHIRKHCSNKALELETIHDTKDASVNRLLSKFLPIKSLSCIADVKTAGDMYFYKYNAEKTLAWLNLKTKRLAECLKKEKIHCGHSALSENYKRSEKATEEIVQNIDFLRVACDIIGGYLDHDLYEELKQYLNLPKEVKAAEDKEDTKKRKSLTTLKSAKNKKLKIEDEEENENEDENIDEDTKQNAANAKLKNSSLLDESTEDEKQNVKTFITSPVLPKVEPLKERVMSAKEKALAKSAKGTKSIASFFKK